MLEVFQLLKKHHKLQLIIRVMPNKLLMQSPEIQQLVQYIKNTEDVFLSIGDQSFLHGDTTQEPLAIEEFELWHSLKYCDLVINLFSTLALEACIFDKPVINMWYFRQPCRMMLRGPVYDPYNIEQHIRRLKHFGATVDAESRDELIRQTFHQLQYPDQRQVNRQRLVNHECGNLDGKAISRLLTLCQTCVKQTS
jgi:CDP-glycerol glycerophosphotransferase (TagB/SpsB family)